MEKKSSNIANVIAAVVILLAVAGASVYGICKNGQNEQEYVSTVETNTKTDLDYIHQYPMYSWYETAILLQDSSEFSIAGTACLFRIVDDMSMYDMSISHLTTESTDYNIILDDMNKDDMVSLGDSPEEYVSAYDAYTVAKTNQESSSYVSNRFILKYSKDDNAAMYIFNSNDPFVAVDAKTKKLVIR